MNIKKFELALAIGLVAAVILGLFTLRQDAQLADRVVRLHVLAASDGEDDQKLKLKVRDSVLAAAEPLLERCDTAEDARMVLEDNLDTLEQAGLSTVHAEGYDYGVSASIEKTAFPTRQYDEFSLPAGQYTALRVTIGPGEGQNWWCVVFPPLCAAAATEEVPAAAEAGGLTDSDVKLISQDNEEYVIRFKFLEWIGNIKNKLSK